jgi:hypothetical protein
MPNYQNGKIYKITSGDLTYIGSTTESTLARRLSGHVDACKRWKDGKKTFTSSYPLIETGQYKITLIEICPCNTKDELTARERFHIESTVCVNKNIPGRTYKEWYEANADTLREYQKTYYAANADTIREQQKAYNTANADTIREKKKAYNTANADTIREQKKAYREANADTIRERDKAYREANADTIREYQKTYKEANKAEIKKRREAIAKV